MPRTGLRDAALVLLLLYAAPAAAVAQAPPGPLSLPLDHWWHRAAVRLQALDARPDAGQAAAGHGQRRLAAAYAARLAAEVGGGPGRRAHLELGPVLRLHDGPVRAGRFNLEREWIGPEPVARVMAAGARADLLLRPQSWLTLGAAVAGHGTRWGAEQLVVEARSGGAVAAWGGRRPLAYAPGAGGLVLSRLERFDGAGVVLAGGGVPLPGSSSAQVFGGRVPANGHVASPWLFGMRVGLALAARFDVGATRVAVFGGLHGARPGVREIAEVLVGANLRGDFADDQVASLDARWRSRLRGLPLEVYGEWGMHDMDPGVLLDIPAFTVGMRAPVLPGTAAGLTLEHTQISGACCGNPPWYQHFELAGGWTRAGVPLGHPLGGQGREWRAALTGSAGGWRVVYDVDAFARTRGAENLYAPLRAGRSAGARLHADALLMPRLSGRVGAGIETGRGWRELQLALHAAWRH
jgi:hypothetical protein